MLFLADHTDTLNWHALIGFDEVSSSQMNVKTLNLMSAGLFACTAQAQDEQKGNHRDGGSGLLLDNVASRGRGSCATQPAQPLPRQSCD